MKVVRSVRECSYSHSVNKSPLNTQQSVGLADSKWTELGWITYLFMTDLSSVLTSVSVLG